MAQAQGILLMQYQCELSSKCPQLSCQYTSDTDELVADRIRDQFIYPPFVIASLQGNIVHLNPKRCECKSRVILAGALTEFIGLRCHRREEVG